MKPEVVGEEQNSDPSKWCKIEIGWIKLIEIIGLNQFSWMMGINELPIRSENQMRAIDEIIQQKIEERMNSVCVRGSGWWLDS